MDKIEYNQKKSDILKQFGEPSSIYDEPNQCRMLLNELQKQYKSSYKTKKIEPLQAFNQISESIAEDKKKEYRATPALPVYLTDDDLKQFTEDEKRVLRIYFEDTNRSDTDIANIIGLSRQFVTRVRRLPAVSMLSDRVHHYLLKTENAMALRKAQLDGDTKIIVELAKKYGNLDRDSLDITQKIKPIEDPALLKYLKELGDKL